VIHIFSKDSIQACFGKALSTNIYSILIRYSTVF